MADIPPEYSIEASWILSPAPTVLTNKKGKVICLIKTNLNISFASFRCPIGKKP